MTKNQTHWIPREDCCCCFHHLCLRSGSFAGWDPWRVPRCLGSVWRSCESGERPHYGHNWLKQKREGTKEFNYLFLYLYVWRASWITSSYLCFYRLHSFTPVVSFTQVVRKWEDQSERCIQSLSIPENHHTLLFPVLSSLYILPTNYPLVLPDLKSTIKTLIENSLD